jgi:hypothetical protein
MFWSSVSRWAMRKRLEESDVSHEREDRMNASRRDAMKAVVAGGIAAAAAPSTAATPGPNARLVHHVFFWLKDHGSAKDREQLIAGLRKLAAIDVVRGLHIGVPAPTEQRDVVDASFDVSELMFFDNAVDQKTYQDHPLHLEFVATCSHLWKKVVVYDVISV